MFDFDPIYLFYLLIGVSAAMFAEGVYLLFYNKSSYRKNINRRLKVMDDKPDRESVLVQLRRERGLTASGDYRLPLVSINQLVLQSGLTIGFSKLVLFDVVGVATVFAGVVMFEGNILHAVLAALFAGVVLPFLVLGSCAGGGRRSFPPSSPTPSTSSPAPCAPAIRCRSPSPWWRAKWPIRSAASSASSSTRSPTAPISKAPCATCSTASAPTTCRCSSPRWRSRARPAAISAKSWQNLSRVIRERFKMRRKIRALAAEGRASAMILSSLPIGMFLMVQMVVPNFYGSVWNEDLTKIVLAIAIGWMGVGNMIMCRMVNFRI